jgi:hypothetical protein
MDIGSLFLILALFILVGLFVSRPLFEEQATAAPKDGYNLSALLAEKERTLTALQELDFDSTLGKVPEEDYPIQRELLVQRGVEVLRRLDALQDQATSDGSQDRLEAAIAARQASGTPATAVGDNGAGNHADDPVEVMIATRRRSRQGKSVGFCAKCGRPLQQSDRFCPKCGAEVDHEQIAGQVQRENGKSNGKN